MATFTIKVSDLIEEEFDFGLTDYPIFDEEYRGELNKKILDHYWNFEIGQETESMFRFSFNRKMREIMPYYNQLYKSTQIQFDPLQTVKYSDISNNSHTGLGNLITTGVNTESGTVHNEGERESGETGEGSTTSTTLGKSRSVSSTTPQVQLSGDEDYASSAADVASNSEVIGNSTNSGTATSSETANSTNNSTQELSNNSTRNDSDSAILDRTIEGSQGIASELLTIYRSTFLNIDMEVIRQLDTLFMQIWDNGDEFTQNNHANWSFGYGFGLF